MKTILLIDSDERRRQLYARLLKRRGYAISHADSGAQASARLREGAFDLAVVDSELGDTSGVNLLEGARDDFDSAPIVFLSSFFKHDSQLYRHLTADLGVSVVLHKPIAPLEFGLQVDNLLRADEPDTLEEEYTLEPADDEEFSAAFEGFAVGSEAQDAVVLLVDDDEEFVAKAQTLGEQLLVDVRRAASPAGALSALDECGEAVAAIFINLDARDDFDAYRLVHRIRARQRRAHPPLAFISEHGRLEDRVQAAHAGAALFLEKPVDSSEFSQAVHQLVSLRRAERPTVLVVDDDSGFAETTGELLEQRGMAFDHLDESTGLLRQLERTDPDALLLNALMPGVSGFDLCRTIRTSPRWQDLPVLFVTDKSGSDTRVAAFRAGGDDVLVKPVVAEELLARIEVRIDRARLMRQRADRDVLTGLLTRRAFLEALAARISEVRRKGRPLAFCLLDVDNFKQINDTHGHIAGDRVLAGLGRLLQNRFRFEDLRGRWGGEEFAIAIVNEDAATAQKILERIKREFAAVDFDGADDQTFQVTFSAGIAQFPDDGKEADQLLKTADRRLYAAKEAGRDRITCRDDAAQ